jgi:hypothetical protein
MMVLASSTLDVLSARSKTWPSLPKFQPSFLDIVDHTYHKLIDIHFLFL